MKTLAGIAVWICVIVVFAKLYANTISFYFSQIEELVSVLTP